MSEYPDKVYLLPVDVKSELLQRSKSLTEDKIEELYAEEVIEYLQ